MEQGSSILAGIRQDAFSFAQAKAAYRLIGNKKMTPEKILSPHVQKTMQRMKIEERVFAVQDTSTLNYGTHLETDGLGAIGIGGAGRGLFLHTTEIFNASGTPIGILDQLPWSREETDAEDHPLYEAEVDRWCLSLEKIHMAQRKLANTQIITLSDRETDFNDYLLRAKELGLKVVVRCKSEIRVNDKGEFLKDALDKSELLGTISLKVRFTWKCEQKKSH